ncbi:PLATZ transcription factor - like 7 [Theobroma cacao]|nr:PLATZ transcription factor - like 7 [Theobroma cacao]
MVGASSIPHWLGILLGEKFFDPCVVHESAKKNEKNIFCLNCCVAICPHCLPVHRPHRRLQIRRYVYQDVIRLSDAQKLINCSLVQPYTTNSAKVVFLNERPMSRPFRGSGNFCINCDRSLQDPFLFCSLSCKVNHFETTKHGGKKLDQNSELLPSSYKTRSDVSVREIEEDPQMTPDSVLDSPVSPRTWSGGSTNTTATSNGGSAINCKSSLIACTATTEFVKKKMKMKMKKSSCVLMPRVSCRSRCSQAAAAADSINRRKGVPRRSPLN